MEKVYMLCTIAKTNKTVLVHDRRDAVNVTTMGGIYNRISAGFATKEELFAHERMCTDCKSCGAEYFNTDFHDPTGKKLRELNICFTCNFWLDRIGNPKAIIINRTWYSDAGNKDKSKLGYQERSMLGHGGREFTYKKDGKTTTTNNLWCGGEIPELFWDRLSDNAEWVPNLGQVIADNFLK